MLFRSPPVAVGALAVAITLAACSEPSTTSPRPDRPDDASAAVAAVSANLDRVAKSLATGLREPRARTLLRDAMRASRYTDHKLVLQDFVATTEGKQIVSYAAAAEGVTTDELLAAIRTLPRLDFYIPSREQRRSWTGTDNLIVTAGLGRNLSTTSGYTPAGVPATRNGTAKAGAADPVAILLQEAEAKGIRIDAQPATSGNVVQDANDGDLSFTIVDYLPNGDSVVTPILTSAQLRANGIVPSTSAEHPTRALTSLVPNDSVFLYQVIIVGVCDLLDCGQTNEFEWKAYFRINGSDVASRKLRITGIPSEFQAQFDLYLINRRPRAANETMVVQVVETDTGGDDIFGEALITPSTFAGSILSQVYALGDNRCGYVSHFGFDWTCTPNAIWRETQQNFRVPVGS
jgi:hypothetical protein